MKFGSFSAGATIEIDGGEYRLIRRADDGWWQVEDQRSATLSMRDPAELARLYESGRLIFLRGDERDRDQLNRPTMPIGSMTERDQAHVEFVARFLEAMAARQFPGWHAKFELDGRTTTAFERDLVAVSRDLGRSKPVSASTYYAWRAQLDLNGDVADLRRKPTLGRTDQVDPRAKAIILDTMRSIIAEACSSRRPHGLKPKKPSEIFGLADHAIRDANREIEQHNRFALAAGKSLFEAIVPPSAVSTWYAYWRLFPAAEREMVTKGPTVVRDHYRGGRGKPRPDACLDRVEYDETLLPMVVYDDDHGFAYGRPWLSWFLCLRSQLPVGFYLGFEDKSDLSLMSALKSACLPKAFLADQYPGVGTYPVYGIPRLVTFDNGLTQHSSTVESITRELRNGHMFAPSSTGWFKAHVESSFKVINESLLSLLPGVVLPNVSRKDYDPYKQGCIGFRDLHHLIWRWIVSVHAIAPHTEYNRRRIDIWNESAERYPLSLISSRRDLDELFWVSRTGTYQRNLDHRGVWFAKLRYFSAELHDLRRAFGDKQTVRLKINPADLGFILVRPRPDMPWTKVEAVDFGYAQGRSLKQHEFCRAEAKKLYRQDHRDAWLAAQRELAELVAELLQRPTASGGTLVGKLLGIGTQHHTAALGHEGKFPAFQLPGRFTALPAPIESQPFLAVDHAEPTRLALPVFEAGLN